MCLSSPLQLPFVIISPPLLPLLLLLWRPLTALFLYFSVISHSFLSFFERSFLSQLSAQKLYGGCSWLRAKTLCSGSFSLSVLVSSNHSICLSFPPHSPALFLFFLLHFLFSEEAEWVESVRSRMLKCALSHTHVHCDLSEEQWGSVLLKGVCLVILWSLCAKAL